MKRRERKGPRTVYVPTKGKVSVHRQLGQQYVLNVDGNVITRHAKDGRVILTSHLSEIEGETVIMAETWEVPSV